MQLQVVVGHLLLRLALRAGNIVLQQEMGVYAVSSLVLKSLVYQFAFRTEHWMVFALNQLDVASRNTISLNIIHFLFSATDFPGSVCFICMTAIQEGRKPKRPAILEDSDSEEEADLELQIPTNKVKLVIGANGTKIQEIQKKSKCRIQARGYSHSLQRI